jgi:hypothetical protein
VLTLDEALRELGVEAGATPDQIRRAYARGLKTRKPEVDPDGFRRLREAYEIAAGETIAAAKVDPENAGEPAEAGGGEPVSVPGVQPFLGALLHILQLQADGKITESQEALSRLRTEIEVQGGEISVFPEDQMQLLWSLTQEMATLSDSFPTVARQAFARALLTRDLARAEVDLRAFAESDPSQADKAVFQLRRSTGLGRIFQPMLLPAHPTPPLPVWSETSHDSVRMILGVLRVSLLVVVVGGSLFSVSRKRSVEQAQAPTGPGWDTQLQEKIRTACGFSHGRKESAAFCRWGPESLRDLVAGNCSEAMIKLSRSWSIDPEVRSAEKSLEAAITQRCYQ